MSTTFDGQNSDGSARHITRPSSYDDADAIFDAETDAERAWVREWREREAIIQQEIHARAVAAKRRSII